MGREEKGSKEKDTEKKGNPEKPLKTAVFTKLSTEITIQIHATKN